MQCINTLFLLLTLGFRVSLGSSLLAPQQQPSPRLLPKNRSPKVSFSFYRVNYRDTWNKDDCDKFLGYIENHLSGAGQVKFANIIQVGNLVKHFLGIPLNLKINIIILFSNYLFLYTLEIL